MQEMSLSEHYRNLYRIQDNLLEALESLDTGFYLTGGTALSRCYLNHRYSDDLDFFIHEESQFIEKVRHIITILKSLPYETEVERLHETFSRVILRDREMILKVDFVNEKHLPRIGSLVSWSHFSRVDNMRNILSNKICALPRLEAKDVADIWWISKSLSYDWSEIIEEAERKAIIEELMVVDLLRTFPASMLDSIKWVDSSAVNTFEKDRSLIIEDIIMKRRNSLYQD